MRKCFGPRSAAVSYSVSGRRRSLQQQRQKKKLLAALTRLLAAHHSSEACLTHPSRALKQQHPLCSANDNSVALKMSRHRPHFNSLGTNNWGLFWSYRLRADCNVTCNLPASENGGLFGFFSTSARLRIHEKKFAFEINGISFLFQYKLELVLVNL